MIIGVSPSHQDYLHTGHKGQFVLLPCRMHHRDPHAMFYNILYHGFEIDDICHYHMFKQVDKYFMLEVTV
ncbi:hypothetical protein DYY67_1531 [Candidatus Nitrosotalea sp. TS]|nr:hypothetical protein [Candidatus Nitrosotalea sp. TS]